MDTWVSTDGEGSGEDEDEDDGIVAFAVFNSWTPV
jgi:hypothetical protein